MGEEGTPHLQGYLEFTKALDLKRVENLLGGRAHLEQAKGNQKQNIAYCEKEGQALEWGERKKQGARSDLVEVRDKIKRGATELEIADEHFAKWCIYRRSFQAYRKLLRPERTWKSEVVVLIGPPGCGKTRFVHNKAKELAQDLWTWPGGRWFDGYDHQPFALFDDWDPTTFSTIGRGTTLQMLDRYSLQVPIKGGFATWAPCVIFITSNYPVDEWVDEEGDRSLGALKRRLTRVLEWRMEQQEFYEVVSRREDLQEGCSSILDPNWNKSAYY